MARWRLARSAADLGVGRLLALCLVLGLALRAPFVLGPLESDEAGLLLVARHLDPDGAALYGDYWVDRPPLLIGYFWLAEQVAGPTGVRSLGLLVSVVLISSAVWAGHQLRGTAGAWWGGLVASSLGSSYAIAAHMVNGPLQAAALVMLSCACTLAAVGAREGSARQHGLAFAAGLAGMCAVLAKQNFVGGLVFAAVLLVMSAALRTMSASVVVRMAVSGGAGILFALLATLVSAAQAGLSLSGLWYATYGFRAAAVEVIVKGNMGAPVGRLATLATAAIVSGILILLWVFVRAIPFLRRQSDKPAVVVAVVVLLLWGLTGLALGASWWRHYLIQLLPACVLMAALVAPQLTRHGRFMRSTVALAVASAVGATVVGTGLNVAWPPDQVRVGRWLAASSDKGDTGFVAWGHAEVLLEAGMPSPYPYLWSLPTRTLDPDLDLLVSTMRAPSAPTWVVEWNSFDSWNIDDDGRLAAVLADRYRLVAQLCGRDVYLLRGAFRQLESPPAC